MPTAARTFGQLLGRRLRPKDTRPSPAARGYGLRWRYASRLYRKQNPLCAGCLEKGRVRHARVTDHIIPHKGDMSLFWDRTNWQGLCIPCHNAKSAKEK